MKKLLIFLFSLFLFTGAAIAQDMVFSQFNQSSMLINPGRLSRGNHLVFGGMYRRMNLLADVNVNSSFFFLESPINIKNKRYAGLGIAMFNSSDGDINPVNMTGGILALNKRLQVTNNSFLSVGFQGGYYYKKLDYNNFSTGSQWENSTGYNPDMSNGESLLNDNADIINLNSGVYWMIPGRSNYVKSELGFSLHHINQPEYTFIKKSGEPQQLTFQAHGRQRIFSDKLFETSLSALYRKGAEEWLTIGTRVTYFFTAQDSYNVLEFSDVSMSAHYNHNRSVDLMLQINRKDMSFGFSYDIGVPGSFYEYTSGGIYEFSFTVKSLFSAEKTQPKKKEPVFVDAEEREFFEDEEESSQAASLEQKRIPDSLQKKIDTLEQLVTEKKEDVDIKLNKNFNFNFNNATLDDEAKDFLDNLALLLLKSPDLKIRITGHADNRGTKEDNLVISKQRSKNVAEYLIQIGIDKDRIEVEAEGASQPLVPNNSRENREKNRRVEFEIYSK